MISHIVIPHIVSCLQEFTLVALKTSYIVGGACELSSLPVRRPLATSAAQLKPPPPTPPTIAWLDHSVLLCCTLHPMLLYRISSEPLCRQKSRNSLVEKCMF